MYAVLIRGLEGRLRERVREEAGMSTRNSCSQSGNGRI